MGAAGRFFLASTLLCGSLAAGLWALGQAEPPKLTAATPEQAEFFEKRVRPVLAERCFSCHGSRLQQGGVRLDSPGTLLRMTGKGRPTLIPGDPEKSALIKAVRYDGAIKMPPTGKLPAKEIETLTQWVKIRWVRPGPPQKSMRTMRPGP
jgi:hypothetical protein